MKKKLVLLTGILLAPSAFALAQDACKNAQTTVEINLCASQEYKIADKKLNKVWPDVIKYFSQIDANVEQSPIGNQPETSAKALIIKAQNSWITLRDKECQSSVYANLGGSIYTSIYLNCLTEKTNDRTLELTNLINDELSEIISDRFAEIEASLPECKDPRSNVELKFCIARVNETADEELNAIYKNAKVAHKRSTKSDKAVQLFVDAEKAWIPLRDAQCDASARSWWGGTGYGGALSSCLAATTIDRTFQILRFYPNK